MSFPQFGFMKQLQVSVATVFLLMIRGWGHQNNTCAQGTYWQYASSMCLECAAGSYQSDTGKDFCIDCKAGKYSTNTGATSPQTCLNCAVGTYAINNSMCVNCPSNTISPSGAFELAECTPSQGYYSSEVGSAGMECPVNYYCVQGTTAPTPCPKGTISNARAIQCVPGVSTVILYDWIFGSVWISLFFCGIVALGLYKQVLGWFRSKNKQMGVIQIKIVR